MNLHCFPCSPPFQTNILLFKTACFFLDTGGLQVVLSFQLCFLIQASPRTKPVAFVKVIPCHYLSYIKSGMELFRERVRLNYTIYLSIENNLYKRTSVIDSFKLIVMNMGIE